LAPPEVDEIADFFADPDPKKSEFLGEKPVELQLNDKNFIKGKLPDGKSVLALIDSGATHTLVSQTCVNNSRYLSALRPMNIKPIRFRIGNGEFLDAKTAINIELTFQGNKFRIYAVVACNLVGPDMLIGTSTLSDLRGKLDFTSNRFQVKPKKIWFGPVEQVFIKPNETKYVGIRGKVPNLLRNSEVVLESGHHLAKICPDRMCLKLHKGKVTIRVKNNTPDTIRLQKHRPIASLDTAHLVMVGEDLKQAHLMTQQTAGVSPIGNDSCVTSAVQRENLKRYRHLTPGDAISKLTEDDVIRQSIDLSDSDISDSEKQEVYDLIKKNRDAFSLYGELGSCPDILVDFELSDPSPFYIRPYPVSEDNKRVIDAELTKLVKLGILEKGHTSYTSPVFLIAKKGTTERRLVADLRYLNSRIKKINHPFPLLSESIARIGRSGCKVLSVLDIKSAFYSLSLSERSQKYVGISSYAGGDSYYYKKLPMGCTVSPGKFQATMSQILREIPNMNDFLINIHDDIILFSRSKAEHKVHLKQVLEALAKHGLRICPRKVKLFQRRVIYLGHIIRVDDDGYVRIEAMSDKCLAIRKMSVPTTSRQVRRFIGAVNYLSMFLPKLQGHLKPLHELTRKNKDFKWSEIHQSAFEKVKDLLMSPEILHAPSPHGRFVLYSDTSRIGTGSHLMQVVDGKERLIAYHSKRLPKAAASYSVSELELFGLLLNFSAFNHVLKGQDFDAFVDHSALVQIVKSKSAPSTLRLQKLLERLSPYSFKLGYRKGSKMELSDFLSRSPRDDDADFDRILPVALSHVCPNFDIEEGSLFPAQRTTRIVTRGYAKEMGITPDPITAPQRRTVSRRRARTRSPRPPPPLIPEPMPSAQPQLFQPTSVSLPTATRSLARQTTPTRVASVPEPRLIDKAKAKPQHRQAEQIPHQHEVEDEYQAPTADQTAPDVPIISNIDSVVAKHIPKQYELDRMLNIIKRKVIRDYNLPIEINALRMAQQSSPAFKSVYDYIAHNILPSDKRAARSIILRAEQFILVNDVLFRLFFHANDEHFSFQLAIPEQYIDTIISRYHDGILSSHTGTVKTYLTLRRNFYFCDNMFERIASYIRGCSRCQQIKGKTDNLRPFHPRIPDRYCPFETVSLDFKSMPTSSTGYKHIMITSCAMTRYLVCVPLKSLDAETICEAFLQKVVTTFGIPSVVVTDAATSLTGKLFSLLCTTLGIDQRCISVQNHGSLMVERHMRTIGDMIKANLGPYGTDWVRYVTVAQFSYNSFASPHLGGHSPHYLLFLRDPPDISGLRFKVDLGLSHTYKEYVENLKARFKHVGKTMLDLQRQQQETQNAKICDKLDKCPLYSVGQLVYLHKPSSASAIVASRKFKTVWCGPFAIHQVLEY
jgi:hypothetical protein